MSARSNNLGRGFEFAFLQILYENIKEHRDIKIINNSSLEASKRAYEIVGREIQNLYSQSICSVMDKIFELEPLILSGNDTIHIYIQNDKKAELGDVRDIIIERKDITWQIGFSLKHNHFAVKHSRLSQSNDFGKKWYDKSCSDDYWDKILPIFEFLSTQKGKKWSELADKESEIYQPILSAFKDEILLQNKNKELNIPRKIVEYLLGIFDFYKIISIDRSKLTQIQTFNLHGTLNQNSKLIIPIINLPSRIINFDFKPNSKNTLELYLDEGWQFNFRLHNASTMIESSLKFDIQIVGMPTTIITINCLWK